MSVLLITMLMPATASAYSSDSELWDSYTMPSKRQKERLLDNAELLSSSEKDALLQSLNFMSNKHSSNIAILTVYDHSGSIQDFADDYFDYNGFQADFNGSGILFMLSMSTREWAISTHGSAAYAFTDYGQEKLMDDMLPYLSDGDYYEAFDTFVNVADRYFTLYEQGTPYDVDYKDTSPAALFRAFLICLLIGFGVALIPLILMKMDLTSVHKNLNAAGYQIHNGIHMTLHTDTYLRSSTSRTPIADNSSRSGGGGGSSMHISSSGSSHGGSHGHF